MFCALLTASFYPDMTKSSRPKIFFVCIDLKLRISVQINFWYFYWTFQEENFHRQILVKTFDFFDKSGRFFRSFFFFASRHLDLGQLMASGRKLSFLASVVHGHVGHLFLSNLIDIFVLLLRHFFFSPRKRLFRHFWLHLQIWMCRGFRFLHHALWRPTQHLFTLIWPKVLDQNFFSFVST